jgi:spore coat polysaccharide biosynthesis protein SpsF
MGSQRLPQKTLKNISGRSLLSIVINSVKQNVSISDVIVATSTNIEDDAIENECLRLNIECFRGHPENVLSRYLEVAQQFQPTDCIARVTADNPVNDVMATKKLFDLHQKNKADYTCVQGLSHTVYEFINVDALLKLQTVEELTAEDKEHVTNYFRTHPEDFKVQQVPAQKIGVDKTIDKLFTIDTKEDFERWTEVSRDFDLAKTPEFDQLTNYFKNTVNA